MVLPYWWLTQHRTSVLPARLEDLSGLAEKECAGLSVAQRSSGREPALIIGSCEIRAPTHARVLGLGFRV